MTSRQTLPGHHDQIEPSRSLNKNLNQRCASGTTFLKRKTTANKSFVAIPFNPSIIRSIFSLFFQYYRRLRFSSATFVFVIIISFLQFPLPAEALPPLSFQTFGSSSGPASQRLPNQGWVPLPFGASFGGTVETQHHSGNGDFNEYLQHTGWPSTSSSRPALSNDTGGGSSFLVYIPPAMSTYGLSECFQNDSSTPFSCYRDASGTLVADYSMAGAEVTVLAAHGPRPVQAALEAASMTQLALLSANGESRSVAAPLFGLSNTIGGESSSSLDWAFSRPTRNCRSILVSLSISEDNPTLKPVLRGVHWWFAVTGVPASAWIRLMSPFAFWPTFAGVLVGNIVITIAIAILGIVIVYLYKLARPKRTWLDCCCICRYPSTAIGIAFNVMCGTAIASAAVISSLWGDLADVDDSSELGSIFNEPDGVTALAATEHPAIIVVAFFTGIFVLCLPLLIYWVSSHYLAPIRFVKIKASATNLGAFILPVGQIQPYPARTAFVNLVGDYTQQSAIWSAWPACLPAWLFLSYLLSSTYCPVFALLALIGVSAQLGAIAHYRPFFSKARNFFETIAALISTLCLVFLMLSMFGADSEGAWDKDAFLRSSFSQLASNGNPPDNAPDNDTNAGAWSNAGYISLPFATTDFELYRASIARHLLSLLLDPSTSSMDGIFFPIVIILTILVCIRIPNLFISFLALDDPWRSKWDQPGTNGQGTSNVLWTRLAPRLATALFMALKKKRKRPVKSYMRGKEGKLRRAALEEERKEEQAKEAFDRSRAESELQVRAGSAPPGAVDSLFISPPRKDSDVPPYNPRTSLLSVDAEGENRRQDQHINNSSTISDLSVIRHQHQNPNEAESFALSVLQVPDHHDHSRSRPAGNKRAALGARAQLQPLFMGSHSVGNYYSNGREGLGPGGGDQSDLLRRTASLPPIVSPHHNNSNYNSSGGGSSTSGGDTIEGEGGVSDGLADGSKKDRKKYLKAEMKKARAIAKEFAKQDKRERKEIEQSHKDNRALVTLRAVGFGGGGGSLRLRDGSISGGSAIHVGGREGFSRSNSQQPAEIETPLAAVQVTQRPSFAAAVADDVGIQPPGLQARDSNHAHAQVSSAKARGRAGTLVLNTSSDSDVSPPPSPPKAPTRRPTMVKQPPAAPSQNASLIDDSPLGLSKAAPSVGPIVLLSDNEDNTRTNGAIQPDLQEAPPISTPPASTAIRVARIGIHIDTDDDDL